MLTLLTLDLLVIATLHIFSPLKITLAVHLSNSDPPITANPPFPSSYFLLLFWSCSLSSLSCQQSLPKASSSKLRSSCRSLLTFMLNGVSRWSLCTTKANLQSRPWSQFQCSQTRWRSYRSCLQCKAQAHPNYCCSALDHLLTQICDPNNFSTLHRGTLTNVAILFNVTCKAISTMWHCAVQSKPARNLVFDVTSRKVGRIGRKRKRVDVHALLAIQLKNRKNMQSITTALGVSRNTIQRAVRAEDIVPHTNAIKPFLTNVNKVARVKFCLSMLDPDNMSMFQNMMNIIHIDKKWFYLTE